MAKGKRLTNSVRLSVTDVARASGPPWGRDVLEQMYRDAIARVDEERERYGFTPLGDVMVTMTAEQWVE